MLRTQLNVVSVGTVVTVVLITALTGSVRQGILAGLTTLAATLVLVGIEHVVNLPSRLSGRK